MSKETQGHGPSTQKTRMDIETGDDTTHPIRHIGNVPFGKEGEQICIKNVLHVVVAFGSGSLRESGGNHRGFGLGGRGIQLKASYE